MDTTTMALADIYLKTARAIAAKRANKGVGYDKVFFAEIAQVTGSRPDIVARILVTAHANACRRYDMPTISAPCGLALAEASSYRLGNAEWHLVRLDMVR